MSAHQKIDELSKSLSELATCLVQNHLRVSLEPSEWDKLVKKNILFDRRERRVIVIVGAGASHSAGLPLGKEALENLKAMTTIPSPALEAELERLTQTYNLDRGAFETNLRALSASAFDAQKLRDNLQQMYNRRFMPVLGYEILAHMMKHRFLDAIINFNFDELLDQSIGDELDQEEYHNILSDGDCPDDSELQGTSLEIPFYIKPHGTASHKSTLRFTREDYYGLPLDIQRIMKHLLTDRPVVLLVVGFGMQSLELNRILDDVKSGSMIFHINRENPSENKLSSNFEENNLLDVNKFDGVSGVLKTLWKIVLSSFLKPYEPRDITRHILVAQTFSSKISESNVEKYLKGRTVVELCLTVAKCKGLINMSLLASDRSGKYFDQYKLHNGSANLYDICKQIGLKDIGYSREALRLMKGEEQKPKILSEKDFNAEIDFLYERVLDNLDPENRNHLARELFRESLLELYKGWEVELRYNPRRAYARIFRSPKPIRTSTALKFYTNQILKKDWNYALFVAETGQFLTATHIIQQIKQKRRKNPTLKIYLIVADLSREDKLRNAYGDIIADIRRLPWWEHNRHMTVLVDSNYIPFAGIYFSRRMRSANIFPVLLDNIDDTHTVLESFNAYWIKASLYKENNITDEDIWISAADAKNFTQLFNIDKHRKQKL